MLVREKYYNSDKFSVIVDFHIIFIDKLLTFVVESGIIIVYRIGSARRPQGEFRGAAPKA